SPHQDAQGRWGEADAGSARPQWALSGGSLDVLLGPPELDLGLLLGIQVQPGLVVEGMVADLVPCRRDRAEELPVLVERGILADDEHGDGEIAGLEKIEDARHHDVQIRWQTLPRRVSVRLQVGPLVVKIERQTGDGL